MKLKSIHIFFTAISLLLPLSLKCGPREESIVAGTYNVRVDVTSDVQRGDGWSIRLPKICDIIKFYGFDILGCQEVHPSQLKDMAGILSEYSVTGNGHTPVFFRSDRFKLLKTGDFWLAPGDSRAVPGWDAAYIRTCTWGKFRDKGTGKIFWFFNTHFDNKGEIARRESAKLMLEKISEITGDSGNVILTGDLNCDQESEPYKLIKSNGNLSDAFETAAIKMAWGGTFNGFNPETYNDSRIDHIFTGKRISVIRYGIIYETYRTVEKDNEDRAVKVRMPSDHYPVLTEISLDK